MTTYLRAYAKLSELPFNVLFFLQLREEGHENLSRISPIFSSLHNLLPAIVEQPYIEI